MRCDSVIACFTASRADSAGTKQPFVAQEGLLVRQVKKSFWSFGVVISKVNAKERLVHDSMGPLRRGRAGDDGSLGTKLAYYNGLITLLSPIGQVKSNASVIFSSLNTGAIQS
jgi:hypothetical protein